MHIDIVEAGDPPSVITLAFSMTEHLFTCGFPLYSIATLHKNEFYVAGGGGQAKTGIPNAIEVHSVFEKDDSYSSQCILQHDLGGDLIMNSEPHPKDNSIIAAGIGNSSHLLKLQRQSGSNHESLVLNTVHSIRTDFNEGDSYQKVVRFNYDGSQLVTGGCDGVVRVWKYPGLTKKKELRGHKSEIEDIWCHSAENMLVSICRGGEALVWDFDKARQIKQFTWQREKYRFKDCRFSPARDVQGKYWLYSLNVPIKWSQQASKQCYVLKWCVSSWKVHQVKSAVKELACAMAISSDGFAVAVGTTEGSISVFDQDLQLLMKASKVHSVFITGLTFIKPKHCSEKPEQEEVLLSISADRTCCISKLNKKGGCNCKSWTMLLSLLLCFASIIILVFVVI